MPTKKLKTVTICALTIILTLLTQIANAQALKVTVTTNKQTYNLGEEIQISGNLTLGGNPVTDGQVAIQIVNTKGDTLALRVIPTGAEVLPPYMIEILEIYSCDKQGNPVSTFQPGTFAYFHITVRNNDQVERNATITLNFYDSTNTPFDCTYISQTLWPQTNLTFTLPELIPSEIPSGAASVYANAFSAFPSEGGRAFCPEKKAQFIISSGTLGGTAPPTYIEGQYALTFNMPRKDVVVGTYTVYVAAYYTGYYSTANATFQTILVGDINHDGKVDMKDIGITVKAFGSTPQTPNWNPNADVNKDNKIDMKDIGIVVSDFGKTCIYP
jgi:hypothetical protein